ncbi:MAG: methyl-accepting chemotaxis protein, partial [Archangium sp.]
MLRRLKKPGLRVALFVPFILALVLILGVLHVVTSLLVSRYLESRLLDHGRAKAQEVAGLLTRPDADRQALRGIGLADSDRDFSFAAIVTRNGNVLLEGGERPERLSQMLGQFFRPGAASSLKLPNGDWLLSEQAQGPQCEAEACRVLVVVSFSPLRDLLDQLKLLLVAAFVIGVGLVVGLIYVVTHRLILRPLDRMMAVARKMAEGDLTSRVTLDAGGGELGQLAEALDGIGQSLRKTLGQVRGVSEVVSNVIEQLSRAGTTVSSGASTIQGRVEETSSSMEEMLASLRGIAENVEMLYQSAEESSSSIMEMAATNDEVAENVQAMAVSVEETTSAIEEMTFSIKEVAKNID